MPNIRLLPTAAVIIAAAGTTAAGTAHADCKLSMVLDRTASMQVQRSEPAPLGSGNTRCFEAVVYAEAILTGLNSPGVPVDYTINSASADACLDAAGNIDPTFQAGEVCFRLYSSSAAYAGANTCASQSDRTVELWDFIGGAGPDRIRNVTGGFIGVEAAIDLLHAEYFDNAGTAASPIWVPKSDFINCPGPSTPLAESVCTALDSFAGNLGGFRKLKILSDGEDNDSTGQCAPTGTGAFNTAQVFNKVIAAAVNGGVDGTLFYDTVNAPDDGPLVVDPELPLEQQTASRVPADEVNFLIQAAQTTGGYYQPVQDRETEVVGLISRIDSDDDGYPDYRDLCDGQCFDNDRDGVPNALDQCPFLKEDGHVPDYSDGCPDADYDGVNDLEEIAPPVPVPAWALGALGLGLLGIGGRVRRRREARRQPGGQA